MTKHMTIIFCLIILTPFIVAAENALLIRNARIMAPDGIITPRSIFIENGLIKAIGSLDMPEKELEVLDAQGHYLFPGMIAPFTSLGLIGIPGSDNDTDELGPEAMKMDPADGLNPEDDSIAVAMIDGVTRALTVSGSRRPLNGFASLMKLHGELSSDLISHHRLFSVVNLGAREKQFPTTLPGVMALLREKLSEGKNGKDKPMQAIVEGRQRVLLIAPSSVAIRNALNLTEEHKLNAVLLLHQDVEPHIPRIRQLGIPVIWAGTTTMPEKSDHPARYYRIAARLHEAGIRFCLTTSARPDARNLRRLPVVAALCVAYGLPVKAATDAITIDSARILGVGSELGSIEEGKRADLILCDRSLIDPAARISHVLIDGRLLPMKNHQTELYQRYDKLVKDRLKQQ